MRKFKISNSFKEADKNKNDGDDWETDPDFEVCVQKYFSPIKI